MYSKLILMLQNTINFQIKATIEIENPTTLTKIFRLDQIRLDFLIRVQTSEKEKLDTTSNLYKLMFAQYRDAQVANISEVGGQLDQRTPETPH